MPKRKYAVRLTEKERENLRSIVSKGKSASRTIKRAHVLLCLDDDQQIAIFENTPTYRRNQQSASPEPKPEKTKRPIAFD